MTTMRIKDIVESLFNQLAVEELTVKGFVVPRALLILSDNNIISIAYDRSETFQNFLNYCHNLVRQTNPTTIIFVQLFQIFKTYFENLNVSISIPEEIQKDQDLYLCVSVQTLDLSLSLVGKVHEDLVGTRYIKSQTWYPDMIETISLTDAQTSFH